MPDQPMYDVNSIPGDFQVPGGAAWSAFQKRAATKMIRIEGPFSVVTSHGGNPVACQDGWLAIDGAGYPYPITDDEVRESYIAGGTISSLESPGSLFSQLAEYVSKQSGGGSIGVSFKNGEWSVMAVFGEEEPGSEMAGGAAHGIGTLEEALRGAAGECGLL